MITLSDGIKWKFPNINYCPKFRCTVRGNRSMLVKHFKDEHAKNSTICIICKKVFAHKGVKRHMQEQHLGENRRRVNNAAVKKVFIKQIK